MKLYIELLVFAAIILFIFFWAVYKNITDYIYKKKYNPNNDKSRRGEEIRRAKLEGREFELEESDIGITRSTKPSE